jgi:peptide deformylase
VPVLTPDVRTLITDMFDTMYTEEGVGLAAPQGGVGPRVIVVDPRQDEVKGFALVNPVVVERSSELDRAEEGCLSIPGLQEIVERPAQVTVEGLDPDGNIVRLAAEGLLARVLQHEIDHLDGVLFIDRVSPLKRKLLIDKWKKLHR